MADTILADAGDSLATTVDAAAGLADRVADLDRLCHWSDPSDGYLAMLSTGEREKYPSAVAGAIVGLARELGKFEDRKTDDVLDRLDAANDHAVTLGGETIGCTVEAVWKVAQRRMENVRNTLSAVAPLELKPGPWDRPEEVENAIPQFERHCEAIVGALLNGCPEFDSVVARQHLGKELQRASGGKNSVPATLSDRVQVDDEIIIIDGTPHKATPDFAALVQIWLDAKGDRVPGGASGNSTPRRMYKAQSKALKDMIDTAPGKGFRLKLPALHGPRA